MSLAPGEAYANLVGVPPANFAANNAGKLRVDPGQPGEQLHPRQAARRRWSSSEGEPMPLQLRRLPSAAIELIEEWIAAGAPGDRALSRASGCRGRKARAEPVAMRGAGAGGVPWGARLVVAP